MTLTELIFLKFKDSKNSLEAKISWTSKEVLPLNLSRGTELI